MFKSVMSTIVMGLASVFFQAGCATVKPPKPEVTHVRVDPAKAERERQIRAAAAEGVVAGGIAAYRDGDIEKARDFFAHAIRDLAPRVHPINDKVSFLPFGTHPQLVPAMEKEFGKLTTRGLVTWIDAEAGYGVLESALAERIAAAYLPEQADKNVFVETAIIEIKASTAREWSRRLTADTRPREWMHPWIPDDDAIPSETEASGRALARLDRDFPDFVRTVKCHAGIQLFATPYVVTGHRSGAMIHIGTTSYVMNKNQKPEPDLSGLLYWIWPSIENDRVRLLLNGRMREYGLCDVGWQYDLTLPLDGKTMVLGRAPSDEEVEKGESLYWFCVRARVIKESLFSDPRSAGA